MSGKLWGGRFSKKGMDPLVMEFTSSLNVDYVLAKYDCLGSKAHVEMLEKCGYMTSDDKENIITALDKYISKIEKGTVDYGDHEDIHSAVQSFVEKEAPEAAKKMHTARSRNEQVVNDVRMYCMDSIDSVVSLIGKFQSNFVTLSERVFGAIIPGYTHLNHAQPILFSHLLLSYVEMFERDKLRLLDAKKRCDISVMGSGALAGSALNLDRAFVAEKLGFSTVSANSLDSVADRDFMVEFVSALSIIAVHLSRISEDFILYSIAEFGFLDMGEEYCTGSSLMPQKKNADVLELIRGRSAQIIGALNSLLILLKGLPQTYNRDLQEDKKFLFESVEMVSKEISIMADLVLTIELNEQMALKQLEDEFIYATDLAEYLVRGGVTFKDAHGIVGNIVKHCTEKELNISDLLLPDMKKFSNVFEEDVFSLLNPGTSVAMKKTVGSTNPDMVKQEIVNWKKRLG